MPETLKFGVEVSKQQSKNLQLKAQTSIDFVNSENIQNFELTN